jgi:ferritin-like metal-binding protein YciE
MAHDRGAADPISLGPALYAGKKVAPDAIDLLAMDHLEARAFFERYHQADDPAEKLSVTARLCKLLAAHMQVEEEIFYPAAGELTGDQPMIERSEEEHDEAKAIIEQLRPRAEADAEHDRLVGRLEQAILRHVQEEETRVFPEVRQAGGVALHGLGAKIAARRLQLLIQSADTPLEERQMQAANETSVSSPVNMSDTDFAPVDPEEARKLFLAGLRNIHALAENGLSMAKRQAERVENYPRVEARMKQHVTEKERQIERVEQILERLGDGPSGLKDSAAKLQANMGAGMAAMAGDEILKNSLMDAAMAQMEIAAYKSLLILGQAAGEIDAIRLLQASLSEERAMAAWLDENLPGTIMAHIQLKSAGEPAKH